MTQYDTRRDARGWTVFDRWTGKPVVVCGAEQTGLDWIVADELVERLLLRRLDGERRILQ